MEQCSECRFWLNWDSEGTNLGECHRFPPRMATVLRADAEGGASAVMVRPEDGGWPLTAPDDWCGEFRRPPERGGEAVSPSRQGPDVGPAEGI
ncbi:MAG TPA: hypothetical protein VFW33_17240 [Gemmataceae bacterium]|nr:hypothetical protein [Gemmataceae bacterium]